jgi:integrase
MLTIAEVQEMAKVADLREQVLLEVFLLGLRIGDVSRLEWKTFDVSGPSPNPIQLLTRKEQVEARTYISEEFNGLLEKYLETIDKSNPYLFQSSRKGYLSEKRINAIFKELGERAGIKSHGLFRWHIGRKLVLRTCAELGVNQWNAKMLVGKSVSKDIATYINGVQLKQDFIKVNKVLRLFPENQSIEDREEMAWLRKRVKDLEFITEQQQEVIAQFQLKLDSVIQHYAKKMDRKKQSE